jgi:hypothetical protein
LQAAEGSRPIPKPAPSLQPPIAPTPKIPVGKLEADPRKRDSSGLNPRPSAAYTPVETSPLNDEYDVEIIGVMPPQPMAPPAPLHAKHRDAGEPRGLFDLNRRDFIMAGLGAGLVIVAILIGWGLSRLLKGSQPATSTPSEQQQPEDKMPTPKKKPPLEEKKDATENKKVEDKKDEKKTDDKKTEDKKPEDKKKDESPKED